VSLLSFVKKSWVFNAHSCRRRSRFSEAKNLAVHIFGNILWCWYSLSCRVCKLHSISSFFVIMMVGYLLLCFFIKPGSMIEKLGELLGPKYSSMEHGHVKCQYLKAKAQVCSCCYCQTHLSGELPLGPDNGKQRNPIFCWYHKMLGELQWAQVFLDRSSIVQNDAMIANPIETVKYYY